ncbi:MAG: MerR family transcriptional regulator [Clostridiales bacterium]|nr:MerR family transcriptional regulator [Clostridiales bacterium]
MMKISEISKLTGISIRTLQYYDKIGLLHPTKYTESGYRLYDDTALEKLQQILLFRELEFPLKEIKRIINSPDFDQKKALEQQITLLTLKKEHLENLISFAREIQRIGGKIMDFSAFDTQKLKEYEEEAKAQWGQSAEFKEFEEKNRNRTDSDNQILMKDFMSLFATFGQLQEKEVDSKEVQAQVKKLKNYITEHFYTCSLEILSSLGEMYISDERMTKNIDKAGGEGTAQFVAEAIKVYTQWKESNS